jgi:hypothetical protein
MPQENYFKGINHVVYISTNIGTTCEHCDTSIGIDNYANSINHYIKAHGYKLLHVGTETGEDYQGNPHHSTIAIVGK